MHLGLFRREHLSSDDPRLIGSATTDQFQRTHGAMQAWSEAEHKDDGSHGAIHADSIAVAPGGITSKGDGIFGGDVVALNGSGRECGLGGLNTVNGVPLLPGEILKTGVLLGGTAAGHFIEHRPTASPPFDPLTSELCVWYLADNPLVMPVLRLGVLSGVPTMLDGGSGKTLDLGALIEPLKTVVAGTVQAAVRLIVGGFSGSGEMTWDVPNAGIACSVHFVPTTDGVEDLGAVGIGSKRWRNVYVSSTVQVNQSIYAFSGEVYAGLYFREAGRGVAVGHWAAFTPAFTSNLGAITMGNGALEGRYTLVGKTCTFKIYMRMGSTTVIPAGALFIFNVPFAMAIARREALGTFMAERPAAGNFTGIAFSEANLNSFYLQDVNANLVAQNTPFIWTTNDFISITGTYEIG